MEAPKAFQAFFPDGGTAILDGVLLQEAKDYASFNTKALVLFEEGFAEPAYFITSGGSAFRLVRE